ncbi:MAG: hypothetical protein PF440_06590 [Thiomicrorhabdus sp.]|jgi:hypothetical protein|nr:hypothetical protein [Thiomicrorhabdus sp.]
MKIDPQKLRLKIDAKNLTTKEVSIAAGWTGPRRVQQILRGVGTNINPRIGEAIARKLKVKVADIVSDG